MISHDAVFKSKSLWMSQDGGDISTLSDFSKLWGFSEVPTLLDMFTQSLGTYSPLKKSKPRINYKSH